VALLTAADFRAASLHEVCYQLDLTTTEAPDAALTATLAGLQVRLEEFCNDLFETNSLTLDLDGTGSYRLILPRRCTAITTLKVRGADGTLGSAQTAGTYELHSSLFATGSRRLSESAQDWVEVISSGVGLTLDGYYDPWSWPPAVNAIQVVGSFGWTTAPRDIKRALALLAYDHFKARRADLRVAESAQGGDFVVRDKSPDPSIGVWTGIDEVDSIISEYRRDTQVAIG
jgi:hypothetical protein